jgi:hypothetical protein
MFRSCLLLIALSLPAAALHAQAAPPSQPSPPVRMQVPPGGAPGAPGAEPARPTPFDEMDANHDGVVTREEYVAYQKKRFDEFDANHDGKIDAKEIASSPPLMERNIKTAERMVKEWDKNGDGIVSADEFQAAAAERFARQDKDGTGKITRPKPPGMPGMPAKGQLMPNGQPMKAPVQPQPQPQPTKP